MQLYIDLAPDISHAAAKSTWSLLSAASKSQPDGSKKSHFLHLPVQEQLHLLLLLHSSVKDPVSTPGPTPLGPSWSANFLRPLLTLQATTTNQRCQQLCQLVLHELLGRLGLHTGHADAVRSMPVCRCGCRCSIHSDIRFMEIDNFSPLGCNL
jgi:hypothetical protein